MPHLQVPPCLTLHTASNIYFEYMFDISSDYSKKLRDHYGVKAQLMDFIGQPEVCRKNINNWASYQTDDHMVEDLLPPGCVGENTRVVAVSTLYFKGDWLHKFDPQKTREEEFHVSKAWFH